MLKPQDILVRVYRRRDGDSMEVIHTPTGIARVSQPPLNTPGRTRREMLREIEEELRERGLTEHLLPEPSRK
jgi:hypothetical protein